MGSRRSPLTKLRQAQQESVDPVVLGHTSLDVTKKHLGVDLELTNAATDRIPLKLKHRQKRLPGA